MRFIISDMSPLYRFYLVQRPQQPLSWSRYRETGLARRRTHLYVERDRTGV